MNCPIPKYEDNYIGEGACRIHERIKDHNGRYHKSYMLKHSIEKHHAHGAQENFKITAKNLNFNNKWKRKILESLWIEDLRATLNSQDKSVQLKLFN